MKYLCLVYCEEEKLHGLPESPEDAECEAYCETVEASGQLVAAEALEPVNTAVTVRRGAGGLRGGAAGTTAATLIKAAAGSDRARCRVAARP